MLEELSLDDNNVGDAGAIALAESLKVNVAVTDIDLSVGNQVSEATKAALKSNRLRFTVLREGGLSPGTP